MQRASDDRAARIIELHDKPRFWKSGGYWYCGSTRYGRGVAIDYALTWREAFCKWIYNF